MKIAVKSLGIAVLAAMLVFAFVGCEESENNPLPTPPPPVTTPVVTDTVINIAEIKGVVVPANRLTPVTTITENEQYRGTVKWNNNPSTFAPLTEYTATITLIPKTGYTLQGVNANFFTVVGSNSVSNAADSGVITAVFPNTDSKYVTNMEIKTQPSKLTYTQGDALSLAGLVVRLTYDTGSLKEVPAVHFPFESITTDPADGDKLVYSTHNEKPIKIAYGKIAYSDFICETNKLDINTPTADDFNISGLTQYYDGSSKTVTITPKEGKSNGTITVKYSGSTDKPSNVGTYAVTFDVAAITDYFNAASGLSAGTLTIEKGTPAAADFNISGLTQEYDGSPKTVTITPKEGKSNGTITVKYNGSTTVPSAVGTYTVTFDVAAVTNFNVASGLSAGTLTIKKGTPAAADFNISGLTQEYDNSPKTVTITPKEGKSNGTITVKYNGSTTVPSAVGTYTVTFDVATATNFNVASGLSAGTLTIKLIIEVVSIPAGTFTMGQTGIETPEHPVTLSGFYMGKYQVTQEQYQAVMGTNPSYFDGSTGKEPAVGETQSKRPVERVSWYDALVFCNKLSVNEGLSPAYSISGSTDPTVWGVVPTNYNDPERTTWDAVVIVAGSTGYRLPTEAQWEYACRAGTTTAYNTGDTISDDTGWYTSNSGSKTHEVGKKSANAWGLYDMHGNVWEWCWDWYGDYSSGAQTDPMGASSGSYRVGRGGSWAYSAEYLRSAYRGYINPYDGDTNLGFRLVRP